jgi:hypothetical protein
MTVKRPDPRGEILVGDAKVAFLRELDRQLYDPQHVHVELAPGLLMKHAKSYYSRHDSLEAQDDPLAHLVGTPVRVTAMAAARIIARLPGARAVAI